MNYNNTSNRAIRTWYPVAGSFSLTKIGTGATKMCMLQVKVEPPATTETSSLKLPQGTKTVDFYYTASNKAEVYLGSFDGIQNPMTVPVPQLPPAATGFIRIQTHGYNSNTEQWESSQYSRAVAYPDLSECFTPDTDLELRAWKDVSPEATTYQEVMATGTELPEGAKIPIDQPIWYTYVVTNNGWTTISEVVVHDSELVHVCTLPELPVGESNGCFRQRPAGGP
jgi:hypothetical protein